MGDPAFTYSRFTSLCGSDEMTGSCSFPTVRVALKACFTARTSNVGIALSQHDMWPKIHIDCEHVEFRTSGYFYTQA